MSTATGYAVGKAGPCRPLDARHRLHGVPERGHETIDLRLADHERRREEDVLETRARDDAALVHLLEHARTDLLVGGERRLGRAILDELHRREEALAAPDIANVLVVSQRVSQPVVESRAHR